MFSETTMQAMGLVYLASLVVGLGVLVVQIALGDRDGAHGASHGGDAGHDDAKLDHAGNEGPLAVVLSLRFWIFALLAFGLSGSLLWYLNLASPTVIASVASAAGIGSGAFASLVIRSVTRSSASSTASFSEAVGREARVLVACSKDRRGQVRIELRGQSVDLLAMTDEQHIERGEAVLIEEVRDGVAVVSKRPPELD